MNSIFEIPTCYQCKAKFKNNEALDVHMKVKHLEAEHSRIDRITKMVSYAVSKSSQKLENSKVYDCSECGEIMKTKEDFETHNKKVHNVKQTTESEGHSENDEIVIQEESHIETEVEIETHKDNTGEDHGITIKSKSKNFKEAKEALKK